MEIKTRKVPRYRTYSHAVLLLQKKHLNLTESNPKATKSALFFQFKRVESIFVSHRKTFSNDLLTAKLS